MDRERKQAEVRMPHRKSRLFELSELPAWLTKDPNKLENTIIDQETLDLLGRGTRQRKEVDYSDSLTEKEWLRVMHINYSRKIYFLYISMYFFCLNMFY